MNLDERAREIVARLVTSAAGAALNEGIEVNSNETTTAIIALVHEYAASVLEELKAQHVDTVTGTPPYWCVSRNELDAAIAREREAGNGV